MVAWTESTVSEGSDVVTATSMNGAASFGPVVRASDDAGAANQSHPALAASAGVSGRVDLAFLDDRSGGLRATTTSSLAPANQGGTEAWSHNVALQSDQLDPSAGLYAGAPSLGGRIGIAVLEQGSLAPAAHTLVAWTATDQVIANHNQDIAAATLLHGTAAPSAVASAATLLKRTSTDIALAVHDPDGDPVKISIPDPPTAPGAAASVPDPRRGVVHFTAGAVKGTEQFSVRCSRGRTS